MKEIKKVVVGGTFEALHAGHRALLKRAFELGDVTIGLTSGKMARKAKKRTVKSFSARKKALKIFVKKEFNSLTEIIKIEDKFGPTLRQDFNYIVVSPETYETALEINKERKKINKKPIKIIEIKLVLSKDGKPISSTSLLKKLKT